MSKRYNNIRKQFQQNGKAFKEREKGKSKEREDD